MTNGFEDGYQLGPFTHEEIEEIIAEFRRLQERGELRGEITTLDPEVESVELKEEDTKEE